MRRAPAAAVLATLVLAAAAWPAPARADDTKDCIAASTQGQQLRDDGRYRRARDAFQTCSRDVCPALVKESCVGWLEDLQKTWPSVVVNATDDKGADLVDVTVVVDGTPLLARLDGKPVLVDPGEHDFHYEASGYPPQEEHVVIHAGEKSRVLRVEFGDGSRRRRESGGGGSGAGVGGPPISVAGIVFGGVAVAALGAAAAVGIPALFDRKNLADGCGKNATCSQGDVDSIHTRFLASDVLSGVGLVSAALSIYFFATSGGAPEHGEAKSSRVDVRPLPGGGAFASWARSF